INEETYGLKPMNCPEGHLIFSNSIRSYKDLPLRLAEPTGKLHRKEVSGSVGGLFRLYQFTQDDAHVYCRPDQIEKEISDLLKLALKIHETFGFKSFFRFATKPDKAIGEPKLWEEAENGLKAALEKNKINYELREKDGTFYGPKIDINVKDSLNREWTIATIQLDFQSPERFELEYIDKDGIGKRPVIIHRAMLGSFERFIGILLEHTNGNLPLWLAPVQAVLIPVSEKQTGYAEKVLAELKENKIRAEIYESGETLPKRIREAELQKIPYILVVGEKEEKNESTNVRHKGDEKELQIEKLIEKIKKEIEDKSI
ncbi:MAG: threonine--tRNA ligase, partial [Patescibacteria group bacterium]